MTDELRVGDETLSKARMREAIEGTRVNDKTTAPKRIYLDIGDEATLNGVRTGRLPWDRLQEVTWSEDNASGFGVAYVREEAFRAPDSGAREGAGA